MPDDAGAHDGAVQTAQHERPGAVRQLTGVLDPGHGAHAGVAAVDLGHEQEQAVDFPVRVGTGGLGRGRGSPGLLGLEGQGHDHLGQDDAGRQRQERQDRLFPSGRLGVAVSSACSRVGHESSLGARVPLPQRLRA